MALENAVREPDAELAAAVDRLLARYGWALLSREAYIERLGPHLVAGAFRSPSAAAFNLYTLELYRACSGTGGPDLQEQAYAELARYLFDLARRRYGQQGDELADEVLGDIFEHFDQCRKPDAFLAFAHQRLRDRFRRRRTSRTVSLQDVESQLPGLVDQEWEWMLAAELRERVARCREQFLLKHKRARLQFEAVWMKYLLGLDDTVIPALLGKEPRQVYVLRARGIVKLRNDPEWKALAADLGIARA